MMIGAKDEVKSDKIEVSFAVASVFDRSHVDQDDIDGAVAVLERALPRLSLIHI